MHRRLDRSRPWQNGARHPPRDPRPSMDMNTTPVFDRLCELLSGAGARYRVIAHEAAGQSEQVAAIRGTDPRQGAKAMLCTFKSQPQRFVLTVLPGTSRLDF